jgi:chromosome segregation ATPase
LKKKLVQKLLSVKSDISSVKNQLERVKATIKRNKKNLKRQKEEKMRIKDEHEILAQDTQKRKQYYINEGEIIISDAVQKLEKIERQIHKLELIVKGYLDKMEELSKSYKDSQYFVQILSC